ncbi:MAG TPA: hypothetical protein VG674_22895 [Amycolatopsis sp.]|nr:hypothetical protein [Amycolatopsis sp.]
MVVAGAIGVLWLGLVLGISFLEAPLKFRAPGVSLAVGLGIGRLVFAALNKVEVVLAVAVWVALVIAAGSGAAVPAMAAMAAVSAVLIVQLAAVRPVLNRRSDRVLAGEEGPRSRAHLWYVGLEVLKVAGLVVLAVFALGA